ncbi:MAG: phosphoglycerate mutase family protein, partial [Bacteroidota bacterium]
MRLLCLAVLLSLVGCTAAPEAADTVVYLVRHAEAEDDGTRDPALSARGQARAERLAGHLGAVDAVYATPYRRTQGTAVPVAQASGVETVVVPIGEAGVPGYVADVEARVRALPAGSVAVVVGHSNTTPQVAGALSGVEMENLNHDQYDRLFVVTFS